MFDLQPKDDEPAPVTTAPEASIAPSTALPNPSADTSPTVSAQPHTTLQRAASTRAVARAVPGPNTKRDGPPAVAQTRAGPVHKPCGPSSSKAGTLPAPTTVESPTNQDLIAIARQFLAANPCVKITDLMLVPAPAPGMVSPLGSESSGASDDLEVLEGMDSAAGPAKKRADPWGGKKYTQVTLALKENIIPAAPLDSQVEQEPSPKAKRTRSQNGKNSKVRHIAMLV